MRLLILITDLERGGTPTVVRELARRLNGDLFEVEVACLAPRGPVAEEIERAGIKVTALDAHSTAAFRPARRRLIQLIQAGRFEVVFSFLVHANFLAASAVRRCPNVRLIQSIQTTQPRPSWHWVAQRLAARVAEKIIVPSRSIALVAERRSGINPEKIRIIPNAIEPTDFESIRRDPARPIQTIGFLGRFDPIKRIGDLIRALLLVDPSLKLALFGDGTDRRRIENMIERLDLGARVKLHGMVDSPREALRQIDLLVLPSRAEGMPMVLIEAMAGGIPIVATQAPGIRDVVTHEQTGLLVPIASPQDLASAIDRLATDKDLRQRLIARAEEEVRQKYTWERVLPSYKHQITGDAQS